MKKKTLCCLILSLLMLTVFSACAHAATVVATGNCGANGGSLTWKMESDGTLTISGSGAMADYSSAQPEWWKNTEGSSAWNTKITKVVVEKGVTVIGESAFNDLNSLTTVVLPSTLKEIKANAFAMSEKLQSITLPDSLTKMGNRAFENCLSLTQIKIPMKLTTLPFGAFQDCISLSKVEFPVTMRIIGGNAFSGCTALTSVDIPDNVVTVGSCAFYRCSNLRSIHLPANLNDASYGMMAYCENLASVEIPANTKTLNTAAFKGCSSLKSITIPKGVTVIGEEAFNGCSSLTSVVLPDSIQRIYAKAFINCNALTNLQIPAKVNSIGEKAFCHSGLQEIKFLGPAPIIASNAFEQCSNLTAYYSSKSASWNSKSLLDYGSSSLFWVPYNGTSVSRADFSGTCGKYLQWSLSEDGVLTISGTGAMSNYMTDFESHYAPWQNLSSQIKTVVLKSGITDIGDYAFFNCSNITRITIPQTVKSIGSSAFHGCSRLADIALPEKLETLGTNVFADCDALKSISVPGTVKQLPSGAFSSCASLTNIQLSNGLTAIGDSAFTGCPIVSIKIPDTVNSIGSGAFMGCSSLTSVNIPDGIKLIDKSLFKNCTALRKLTLPSVIAEIDDDAFANLTLDELRFAGEKPNRLSDSCFKNSTATIYYPSSCTSWKSLTSQSSVFGGKIKWSSYSTKQDPISLSKCEVSQVKESFSYTGSEHKPEFTVTFNGTALKKNTDFKVSYANNINAGTATATIEGIGKYTGSVKRQFTIKQVEPKLSFESSSVEKKVGDSAFTNPLKKTGDGKLTYSSNNTSVASVNSTNGQVTIHKAGSAVITATLTAGTNYRGGSASYTLTVAEKSPVKPTSSLSISSLTYNFGNSHSAYGYKLSYRIPLDRYMEFFSETEAKWLYNANESWGGNCYGMSTTSSLFNVSDSGLSTSMYNRSAVSSLSPSTYSDSLNMDVTKMIEIAQIAQYTDASQNSFRRTRNNLANICNTVISEAKAGRPVLIGVMGAAGGHAIVGYKIEKIDSKTSYLYVYDCNFPGKERYIKLTTDADGNFTDWYYKMNDSYDYGNNYGCAIDCVPYSVYQSVWQGRSSNYHNSNTLRITSENFEILSEEGEILATMTDGEFLSNSGNIYEYILYDVDLGGATLISLPSDVYELVDYDDGAFTASILNKYQSSEVTTTADSIVFAVVDSDNRNMVYVDADNGDTYSVTMNSELNCAEGYEELVFSGIGAGESVELGILSGELFISDSDNISLTINGELIGSADQPTDISLYNIALEYDTCSYDGTAKQPAVSLSLDGYTLKNGHDYTLMYTDNVNVGTASVAIYGEGSFTGSVFATFEILNAFELTCDDGHTWDDGTIVYNTSGKPNDALYTCVVCGTTKLESGKQESSFELVDFSDKD